jgi:hypothetical protein
MMIDALLECSHRRSVAGCVTTDLRYVTDSEEIISHIFVDIF